MDRIVPLMACACGCVILVAGCGGSRQAQTGFLSDYSKLNKESDTVLRYVNKPALPRYSRFIIDYPEVYFHSGAKGPESFPGDGKEIMLKRSRILVVVWMLLQPVPGVAPAQVAGDSGTMSTDTAGADSLATAGLAEIDRKLNNPLTDLWSLASPCGLGAVNHRLTE